MRAFWALVALLAAIGAWFVLASAPDDSRAAPGRSPPMSPPTDSAPPEAPAVAPTSSSVAPDTDSLADALTRGLFATPSPPAARAPLATDPRSPADITRRLDARTLELDGRFRIVGNGSPDDPYRISWELLTSAGPFIDPAQQALAAPPWVRAVDGTYVEISAYYSTAIRVESASHVLLTLNRWDGCCIGLPPTPFDAIDTALAKPIDMKGAHLFRFGTFRGRLVVEPFAAGTFLLGFYRLEDATFVVQ